MWNELASARADGMSQCRVSGDALLLLVGPTPKSLVGSPCAHPKAHPRPPHTHTGAQDNAWLGSVPLAQPLLGRWQAGQANALKRISCPSRSLSKQPSVMERHPPQQNHHHHHHRQQHNDRDDALPAKLRVLVDFARHQEEQIKTLQEVS